MGLDPVIPFQVYRSGPEVCLHCAEAVLDDPSAAIYLYYLRSGAFKVCTYAIKAIEARFLIYYVLIEREVLYLSQVGELRNIDSCTEMKGMLRVNMF